ncbi:MAG: tetratricopeptide repeat protein, partial [Myxococcales bacterium]|nr:tetratricopeptide repeat protein [Myxococcales bacterium]
GHYATALAAFERQDDPYEIAWSLMGLGSTQRQMGNLEGAERWSRRGLASFERMGGRLGIGHAHNELGEIARFRGDHDGAIAHYEEVLVAWGGEAHRDLDLVRYNLGLAHLGRGDVAEAQTTMLSLERRATERGRKALLLFVTTGLCAAAAAAGDFATCESRAEVLGPMLEALPLVDLDIASSLQLAGDHARRAGHDELAKKLHAWGRAQYLALGDETAAAALA